MSTPLEGYEVETQLAKGLYVARRGPERFVVKTFEAEPPPGMLAALRLKGPWVAEVRDVGLIDTRQALVSEWVDGLPLSELVAAAPDGPRLSLPLALYVSFQVARALTAAHELEGGALIHGALDLTHVLCARGGAVKVCNFGRDARRDGRLRPQAGFVAPEVLGGGAPDVLSDVYACGALAYLVVTGKTPSEAALLFGGNVPPPSRLSPGIDAGLDATLLEMVAVDPGERAFSVRALSAAIDRYAEGLELELDGTELDEMLREVLPAPARAA
jgi:serine/threonine protein kinase